jgi:hypothetical protein
VVDLWGKFQHGILDGNLQSFGDFDRCEKFSHSTNFGKINGKYCIVSYESKDVSDLEFDFDLGWQEM